MPAASDPERRGNSPRLSTRIALSPPTPTFRGMTYARIRGEAGTLGMVALGVMLALLI
jgi:hypothetical protein